MSAPKLTVLLAGLAALGALLIAASVVLIPGSDPTLVGLAAGGIRLVVALVPLVFLVPWLQGSERRAALAALARARGLSFAERDPLELSVASFDTLQSLTRALMRPGRGASSTACGTAST